MAGKEEVSSKDIASTLDALGETTTAAELVRKQGQSKKLKVVSEKKLMEWILSLLKQHMAGKADAFSDAEKEELLRKTQDELKKRMLREQASEAERARLESEKEQALQAASKEKAGKADYEKVIASLKAQLENAQNNIEDLQQDNYDLQDQLQEKMALLSTTIAEKDKLRETVRNQMVHSGDLIGGVLGIDNQYYGGRHQEENPVPEEAGQDEQFYHDFGTGAKVIETLNSDLERMRAIAQQAAADKEAADRDPRKNLLESDLAMLEQLKAGSLQAMDVAQPVATLIEALEGARNEAETMEDAVARVTGNSSQKQPFTSLPDPDGEPSEVLAGAATVARELAAELARSRQRVIALKQIADEAENERGEMETGHNALREAHDKLLAALAEKAKADQHPAAAKLADGQAEPAAKTDAALAVLEGMQAGSPEAATAMAEQLALSERLMEAAEATPSTKKPAAKVPEDQAELAARLRDAGAALEKLVLEQRRELAEAERREQALAAQVRELAKVRAAAPDATHDMDVERSAALLDQALDKAAQDPRAANDAAAAAEKVIEALQRQAAAEQASTSARLKKLGAELEKARAAEAELEQARAEVRKLQDQARARASADKAIANQVMKAAKGDDALAEATADLALAAEQGAGADAAAEELAKQLQSTVAALSARKVELARANEKLAGDLEKAKADSAKAKDAHGQAAHRERELADALVDAAKRDPELAEAAADLALALEEAKPDEPIPADISAHAAGAIKTLSERKQALAAEAERLKTELEQARAQIQETDLRAGALEAERDEMAESGKEIIGQLRQQKDAREKELAELRDENDKAAAKLEEFQGRMTRAEAANRKLAEALTAFAGAAAKHEIADAPSVEDPRMDLEVTLSQLPSEGEEEDVVVPADIAEQIADGGAKLAQALAARHTAAAAALSRAEEGQQRLLGEIESLKGEIAKTRATLEERDSALKRNQAEVTAIRREMSDQGNALAARVQELSNARSELAGAKADMDTANQRLTEQEARLNEARAQLADARKELERIRAEHAEARSRADAAEQNQLQIAQSLRSLGSVGGQSMNEPVSKAAQKLELAKNVGGEDLATAGKAFVEAVKTHAQNLSGELASARTQLDGAKAENARLSDDLAKQRAALVDREHTLESLKAEAAKADEVRAQAATQMMEKGAELESLKEKLAQLQDQLRQVEAELEDYRAREGASAGHLGDEVSQLRAEVGKELAARKQLEAQLHDLREKVEASEARLKRQREEFTRRLEERDAVINEKDRLLDEHGARKVDAHGLEAQVEALTKQLGQAQERVNELEGLHGAHAGATSKSGDLAKELKKAQAERDALREKQRRLESDLADAVSSQEELHTQLDEKRKEVQAAREDMTKELTDERAKTAMLKEEFRKLKEEVVGLRARLRRLTDDKH